MLQEVQEVPTAAVVEAVAEIVCVTPEGPGFVGQAAGSGETGDVPVENVEVEAQREAAGTEGSGREASRTGTEVLPQKAEVQGQVAGVVRTNEVRAGQSQAELPEPLAGAEGASEEVPNQRPDVRGGRDDGVATHELPAELADAPTPAPGAKRTSTEVPNQKPEGATDLLAENPSSQPQVANAMSPQTPDVQGPVAGGVENDQASEAQAPTALGEGTNKEVATSGVLVVSATMQAPQAAGAEEISEEGPHMPKSVSPQQAEVEGEVTGASRANNVPSEKAEPGVRGEVAGVVETTESANIDLVEGKEDEAEHEGALPGPPEPQPGAWERDVYVAQLRQLLDLEREAEEAQVSERLRRPLRQLEADGFACSGLWPEARSLSGESAVVLTRKQGIPFLAEVSVGRTVLLTNQASRVAVANAQATAICEVISISSKEIVLVCHSSPPRLRGPVRLDAGPNTVAQRRLSETLTALQLGGGPDPWQHGLGLVSPGTPLASAIFSSLTTAAAGSPAGEGPAAPPRLPALACAAELPELARAPHYNAPPPPWVRYPYGMYRKANERLASHLEAPPARRLNPSQVQAVALAMRERRQLALIQGPPGTGKTATAIELVLAWLRAKKGPVLATAFSNKGVDNLAKGLWERGANVVRLGTCDPKLPYSLDGQLLSQGFDRSRTRKANKDVLGGAHVICATCIGAGMAMLETIQYPYVVIDEAAQVIEPAALIPLAKGSVQVVKVGDHCQLPATVISREAEVAGLGLSLFERLLDLGVDAHMLSVQYRMHLRIASFPSWKFYGCRLQTGVHPEDRPAVKGKYCLGALSFIHVPGEELGKSGTSKSNPAEVECVQHLIEGLDCDASDVGVIAPYSAQISAVRRALRTQEKGRAVQVATVDGFQGSEKEVIILSLVRSNADGNLGFVADWRRLNVSVTRARRLLVVVGNLQTICHNDLWRDFVGLHPDMPVWAWQEKQLKPLQVEVEATLQAARSSVKERQVQLPGLVPGTKPSPLPAVAPPKPQAPPAVSSALEGVIVGSRDALRVKARARLQSQGLVDCLNEELTAHIAALRKSAPHLCIEDFDTSENPISEEQFGEILAVLAKLNAPVELLRFNSCPALAGTAMHHLAIFLRSLPAAHVPLELHLSACSITTSAFRTLMHAIEGSASFPRKGRPPVPLLMSLENNLIAEEVIQEKIDAGIIEALSKTQFQQGTLLGGAKVRMVVREEAHYQQAVKSDVSPMERPRKRVARPVEPRPPAAPALRVGVAADSSPLALDLATAWGECLLEATYLRCCKRRAVMDEDFDLAQRAKSAEADVSTRLATSRRRALSIGTRKGEWEELQQRKRQAVAREDYPLAAELKRKQAVMEEVDVEVELAELQERKKQAAAAEDFELAAELKSREERLRSSQAVMARQAAELAASLLAAALPHTGAPPLHHLAALPQATQQSAREAIFAAVKAELSATAAAP